MGRTIAIGDIHGCNDALKSVLSAIDVQSDDTIVTLGDYVDRGPDSRGVIETLLDLQQRCQLVTLRGNHEAMMIRARECKEQLAFWSSCGGLQTLESYDGSLSNVPQTHWRFLDDTRIYYEQEEVFFIHANYDPSCTLDDQEEGISLWTHLSYGIPLPHPSRKTAFVGHTPQADCRIGDWGYLVCIDTCCFGGGCLTACDVDTRQLWQADINGNLR